MLVIPVEVVPQQHVDCPGYKMGVRVFLMLYTSFLVFPQIVRSHHSYRSIYFKVLHNFIDREGVLRPNEAACDEYWGCFHKRLVKYAPMKQKKMVTDILKGFVQVEGNITIMK